MRARLLDKALTLAAQKGPSAVSVDDVISAAEVSRGTFYKYFDAPDTLIQELAAEVSKAVIEAMHPLVRPITDPAKCVSQGMRTALRLVRAYPVLGAFMVRAGWPALERTHLFFTVVGVDLKKGIRTGRFTRMHLDVALNLLAGSMVGAMHSITSGRMPRDFPEQTAAALLRALGLAADEALAIASSPLVTPSIDPTTLVGRLMAGTHS